MSMKLTWSGRKTARKYEMEIHTYIHSSGSVDFYRASIDPERFLTKRTGSSTFPPVA
jgi:hypothetical protein